MDIPAPTMAMGTMGTTEPKANDRSSVGRAGASSANREAPPVDRDCQKCLSFLTRALDRVGERPQSLLRALGVMTHSKSDGSKLYELKENTRGVLISLENKREATAGGIVTHDKGSHLLRNEIHRTDVPIGRGGRHNIPLPAPDSAKEKHSISDNDGSVTLVRRLTQAAHLIADGIRHSAEDILNDGAMPNGSVLTTSPAAEPSRVEQDPVSKNVTTIAIECQTCGSESRAEAGARAFVRGPDPLSIVLCSNRLSSQREVDEVLVHELVHIYDFHSRKMDLRDCHQLARSEVRAAREAECSNSFAQFTANICVKDKATVATRNMFPEEGKKCVCDVFAEAMSDMAPFDEGGGRINNPLSKAGRVKVSSPKRKSDPHGNSTPLTPPFSSARQSDR